VATIRGDGEALADLRMRDPATGTMEAVFASYTSSPVDAGTETRKANVLAAKNLLAACGLSAAANTIRRADVGDTTARSWFTHAKLRANAEPDPEKKHTIYRTANSWFNQANSLFCMKALDWYRQEGCYSPSFEAFSKTGRMLRFGAKYAPKSPFDPAPDELLAKTLDAWRNLKDEYMSFDFIRGQDKRKITVRGRDMFMAIGHELAFGLRRAETAQACWGWWSNRPGYPVLDAKAVVKNGTGKIRVRALDPWFTILKRRIDAEGWRGEADEFIIKGCDTYRTDDLFRAIGSWMRNLGWTTRKTNHALRAYSGSQIYMRYEPYEAQAWLRHSSLKVTETYYSQYVKDFKPANLEDLPARWATLECPEPQLRVLPQLA